MGRYLLLCLCAWGLAGCLDTSVFSDYSDYKFARTEPATGKIDERRLQVVGLALAQLGTPYSWGGSTPERGFDCSGLVQYTYNNAGIAVPRTASEQFSLANRKSVGSLLPGDLLFFHLDDNNAEHVAIYLGSGEFIHAPSNGNNVRLENIYSPYWKQRLYGVGTYL